MSETVVLTRMPQDNAALAAALRARALRVVELPCVRVERLADPAPLVAVLAALTRSDTLGLTSRHAADAVADALGTRAVPSAIAAVGAATAQRCAARGLDVTFVPSRPDAAALAAELPLPEGAVVLPRSDRAMPELVDVLRARGARVRTVVAYRNVLTPPDAAAARAALGRGSVVVFASPSAVDAMLRSVRAVDLARCRVIATGPATAAHVERRIGAPAVIARWEQVREVFDDAR